MKHQRLISDAFVIDPAGRSAASATEHRVSARGSDTKWIVAATFKTVSPQLSSPSRAMSLR
jgi:hypothetical protein